MGTAPLGKWGQRRENGDSALFLEEKIGRCPHFPHFPKGAVPIFPWRDNNDTTVNCPDNIAYFFLCLF